jgi:hypothetical protein
LEFDEGLSRAEAEAIARREMVAAVYDDMQVARDPGSYASALAVLRANCPACVREDRWHQAIVDATVFTPKWGRDECNLALIALGSAARSGIVAWQIPIIVRPA